MTDFKKCHGLIAQFGKLDLREVSVLIPKNSVYELPDGTPINVSDSPEIFCTPEMHYVEGEVIPAAATSSENSNVNDDDTMDVDDDSNKNGEANDKANSKASENTNLRCLPLHKLAHESLTATDADARKELLTNITLVGSGSLYPGFEKRLTKELNGIVPTNYRVKVTAMKGEERANAAWIGGSILTSLGSFQQLWLSKTEYHEYGSTLGVQRFPGI